MYHTVVPLFLATVGLLSSQEKEDKYALVIGISEYPQFGDNNEAKLKYAARDAVGFADFIKTPQGGAFKAENVHLVTDRAATRAELYEEFGWLLKNAGPDALVYVFFAGHGVQYRGRSYFLPSETSKGNIVSVGIPMEEFLKSVTHDLAAKQVVVFVDACHAAGAASGARDPISPVPLDMQKSWSALNNAESNGNQLAMGFFSSMANQPSFEDDELDGGHGLFTYYLLQGLSGRAKTNGGFIDGGSLFDYVREQVQDRSRRRFPEIQTPTVTPDFSSRFKLAHSTDGNVHTGGVGQSEFRGLQRESSKTFTLPNGVKVKGFYLYTEDSHQFRLYGTVFPVGTKITHRLVWDWPDAPLYSNEWPIRISCKGPVPCWGSDGRSDMSQFTWAAFQVPGSYAIKVVFQGVQVSTSEIDFEIVTPRSSTVTFYGEGVNEITKLFIDGHLVGSLKKNEVLKTMAAEGIREVCIEDPEESCQSRYISFADSYFDVVSTTQERRLIRRSSGK